MRRSRAERWSAWCIAVSLVGVFAWVGLSGCGGGSGAPSGGSGGQSSANATGLSGLLLGSLVVPEVQRLDGDQQAGDAQTARHDSATAYVARIGSRTAFRHLGSARALQVASEAFPKAVDRPAGGAPKLPADVHIARYIAPNAAQLELPHGRHGVMESTGPIAHEASPGHYVPVDLALTSAGDGYEPADSDVAVRIPEQLEGGVQMPQTGVALTPVDAQGAPLHGQAQVAGDTSVLYANTQTDTDTLVKPTADGFEIDAILRSPESPGKLYFSVGMPSGAKLESDGRGGARVVRAGHTMAAIPAPSASDTAEAAVPVTMSVAGDMLVVSVQPVTGTEYQYPLAVDPNVYDTALPIHYEMNTNWKFSEFHAGHFESYPTGEGVVMGSHGAITANEYDELIYEAKGEASAIYIEEESQGSTSAPNAAISSLEFAHGATVENSKILGNKVSYPRSKERLCVPAGPEACGEGSIAHNNEVRLQQWDTYSASAEYGFWAEIYKAEVGVEQWTGPTAAFNTSEATLPLAGGRQNVLYGSGGWLGEYSGALEIKPSDPGLGVSYAKIRGLAAGESWQQTYPFYEEHLCAGVWCNQHYEKGQLTYNSAMQEGEHQVELCVENTAHMQTCNSSETLKVDNTAPYNLKMTGLAEEGAEISATPHQISVEVTDGTKPTPSSGIKSITAEVDGEEIGEPQGYCSPGECTGSGKWTIHGETLGAGVHDLTVTATDNAGNETIKEYTFAVRNSTPLPLGPGTVDPASGQFELNATDVSQPGVGGISRTYQSRKSATGSEGPFGSKWGVSLGTAQRLTVQPDGSVLATGVSGGLTMFTSKGKGEFESPAGDSNVTLKAKENEQHQITEYLLEDQAQKTTTAFVQPEGTNYVTPSYAEEIGASGASSERVNIPGGVALDSSGNVWVDDTGDYQLKEYSPSGSFIKAIGSEGSGPGELSSQVQDIAVSPTNGNLYVTDAGHNRVIEFSPSGTYETEFGEYGSANGQFNGPDGITVDSKGNVGWWIRTTTASRSSPPQAAGWRHTRRRAPTNCRAPAASRSRWGMSMSSITVTTGSRS